MPLELIDGIPPGTAHMSGPAAARARAADDISCFTAASAPGRLLTLAALDAAEDTDNGDAVSGFFVGRAGPNYLFTPTRRKGSLNSLGESCRVKPIQQLKRRQIMFSRGL